MHRVVVATSTTVERSTKSNFLTQAIPQPFSMYKLRLETSAKTFQGLVPLNHQCCVWPLQGQNGDLVVFAFGTSTLSSLTKTV
jgi:hypothetical protein